MNTAFNYRDCAAVLAGDRLTIQNARLRRSWLVTDTALLAQELIDAETGACLTCARQDISPVAPEARGKIQRLSLQGREDDDCGFGRRHLRCELELDYGGYALILAVSVYPELPLLRTRLFIRGREAPAFLPRTPLDGFELAERHIRWENVRLRAVTDFQNNPVERESGLCYPAEERRLSGNLLRLHRTLSDDGLMLVKESPTGAEQFRYAGWDFALTGRRAEIHGAGFETADVRPEEPVPLYGTAAGWYHGGEEGFHNLLRAYHEARHIFRPEDAGVFSNTWGDDSGGRKIQADFLAGELAAARSMHVTHYQIDAGWSGGGRDETGRSRWVPTEAAFPQGLPVFTHGAEQEGLQIGLWFEPFTCDGYAAWGKDADTLTGLARDGAAFFKLDGFKIESYLAAWRLEKMMRRVIDHSGRPVFFNMDVTNWPRTGFWGATQYGDIFMENRYTDRVSYYPHTTLRNLWRLSRYFPACRLQSEFLNVARNAEKYEKERPGDPLAPARCGQEYAAAVTLFGGSLAWMEPSELPPDALQKLGALFGACAAERGAILSGDVRPIGDEPDGCRFTGFQSIGKDGGYLLLLREYTREAAHVYRLGDVEIDPECVTVLAANCGCRLGSHPGGGLSVSLDRPFGFAVCRYRV